MVLLIPARFQVDDADYGHLKEAVDGAGGHLVRDAATQRFDDVLAGLPVPTASTRCRRCARRCRGRTSSSSRPFT